MVFEIFVFCRVSMGYKEERPPVSPTAFPEFFISAKFGTRGCSKKAAHANRNRVVRHHHACAKVIAFMLPSEFVRFEQGQIYEKIESAKFSVRKKCVFWGEWFPGRKNRIVPREFRPSVSQPAKKAHLCGVTIVHSP
jgi:hypothetical protein